MSIVETRKIVATYALAAYKPAMPPIEKIPMISEIDLNNVASRNQNAWRCNVCGYVHYGNKVPGLSLSGHSFQTNMA